MKSSVSFVDTTLKSVCAMTNYSEMFHWLALHFETFAQRAGVEIVPAGMIDAHSAKSLQYEEEWAENGIPFAHGIAVHFLTYLWPYSDEVRETANGWVDPCDWVVHNYHHRFRHLIP